MPAPRFGFKRSLKALYDWLDKNVPSEKAQITALTAIATPNATDLATNTTLNNANKAKINEIIAALKAKNV